MSGRALRAAAHFSADELKDLAVKYPLLKHIKEALAMKNANIRVYVASPYETMLNRGFEIGDVEFNAKAAINEASRHFNSKFELFSPVLSFGREELSRQAAMKRCFDELGKCLFLFIPAAPFVVLSEGIYEEFKFAKERKICVIFGSVQIRDKFERRLKNEK